MASPLDPLFWHGEQLRLFDDLAPLIMRVLLLGAAGGVMQLPPELQVLINWDLVNDAAIGYLHQYQLNTVAGITRTTQRQAVKAIDEWMRSGAPLDVLKTTLGPIFGQPRADMVGITEVTRIFADGNRAAWKATGVVSGRKWQTAVDERVCPICRPLHNKITSLDTEWNVEMADVAESPAMRELLGDNWTPEAASARADSLARSLGASGFTSVPQPAHPRCRCYSLPVVSVEQVREQIRADLADVFISRVEAGEYEIALI